MLTRLVSSQLESSQKSVLLLGPRQVGKSTLLESLKPDLIINLANEAEFLSFASNPSELEQRLSETSPKTVFIDEIQRLPNLLNTIQSLIDQKKVKRKFYISGSSARKLKRGSANLLPGRLFNYRMGPLSCAELDFKMNTTKALETGCLPEAYTESREHAEKLLDSYTATYLREEILAESLTRQIQGFSRFLQNAAYSSGQLLDFSKLAAKAKVNRTAARRYFELLEGTLLCDKVEAYQIENADLVKHPKYYFFDIGVVNAVLKNFKASDDRSGLLMEHLFFNQLKNTAYALDQHLDISFFRTRNGLEVDFIIEIKGRTILVEVKAGGAPTSTELNPINQVKKYFDKKVEAYVACGKNENKKINDIRILGWQQVIKEIFNL